MAESSGVGAGTAGRVGMIEPSIRNALPYFMSLAIFPLVAIAAVHGGWWIAGPFLFLWIAEGLEAQFGVEERNMDPKKTLERQLFWYKLPVWLWAVLWPVTLVFSLWQILVVGRLSTWEALIMAAALASVAQASFIVGHELIHRRSVWERRIGEFLLASVSYPHYATEHTSIHHALACTPGDAGSAPKGQSFWRYLPQELERNLIEAWCFERDRLARLHLPVWHYTNPFWRYVLETAAWYALVYWMGGAWVVLIFAIACASAIFSMKLINYVQHYGLRRIRLPNGRFERVQAWHSWNASYKLTNWLYYNMQRHPDHHVAASRRYPLLQYHGGDTAPQLPGSYMKMAGLALVPRRWFQEVDPLVDSWRAYDSPATAARPDAFEAIVEILGSAPRLAAWVNRAPELLDNLREKEFTDLDLPDGFGPDQEFERVARRGLARVYWRGRAELVERQGLPDRRAYDARQPVAGRGGDGAVQRCRSFHQRRAVGRRGGFRCQCGAVGRRRRFHRPPCRRRGGGGGLGRSGQQGGGARRRTRRRVRVRRRSRRIL